MDRREFLTAFWKRRIKPVLIVIALIFSVLFFVDVFTENGKARFIVIVLFGLGIVFLVAHLLGILFSEIFNKIYSRFTPNMKRTLKLIGQIITYLTPIYLGILLYQSWMRDWLYTSLIVSVILIERIVNLVKLKNGTSNSPT